LITCWLKAGMSSGRILRWFGAATNVDAMLRAREALRESEARLAAIIGQAVVGIGQLDPDGRLLLANDALCGILGRPREDVLGRPARELTPPENRPATDALYARVFETGEPFAVEESRVRPDGATVWVRSRVSPVRGAELGRPRSAVAVVEDVTERVAAERRQARLVAELNHRVKNVLASVQSVADQTLRSAGGDPARFAADFGGRLRALARAHDLLTKRAWAGAELGDSVGAALAPWLGDGGRERLSIAGCAGSTVGPQQAQTLVLALHELATNAAKHGALSRPGGAGRGPLRARARWPAVA
jgi:PAS domain S-box-containing protein